MRFVVDSNILFTFFWKDSVFRSILEKEPKLFSPEYALSEIKKYSSEIIKKTGITKEEFNSLRKELAFLVEFIPLEDYSSFLKKIKSPDVGDVDFLALSLKLSCPLWSNDRKLKDQDKVDVLNTKEVIILLS